MTRIISKEECALFVPFDELKHVEPLRETPKIVGYTHEQFMEEHNQAGWLAWQLTRPLRQPKRSSQPIDLNRRPKSVLPRAKTRGKKGRPDRA